MLSGRLSLERAEIARELQHGLLPPQLPDIPGLDVAALYRPAGELNEVGGRLLRRVPDARGLDGGDRRRRRPGRPRRRAHRAGPLHAALGRAAHRRPGARRRAAQPHPARPARAEPLHRGVPAAARRARRARGDDGLDGPPAPGAAARRRRDRPRAAGDARGRVRRRELDGEPHRARPRRRDRPLHRRRVRHGRARRAAGGGAAARAARASPPGAAAVVAHVDAVLRDFQAGPQADDTALVALAVRGDSNRTGRGQPRDDRQPLRHAGGVEELAHLLRAGGERERPARRPARPRRPAGRRAGRRSP